MDSRAAKLALARKKLKDHQEKKQVTVQRVELIDTMEPNSLIGIGIPKQKEESEITINEYQAAHNVNTNSENNENSNSHQITTTNSKDLLDMNVAELLISNKRNLENQVTELHSKLADLDSKFTQEVYCHNDSKQRIIHLESELLNINGKYAYALDQLQQQNTKIEELNVTKSSLLDTNNNLAEQLEFTKTILTAKETENASLHSQLEQLNRELEVSKLQLQQLLNGSNAYTVAGNNSDPVSNRNEELLQKVDNLEQQLKMVQKERDQLNMHYEHYVGELNEQLKMMMLKNEELSKQVYHLSNRESSLIDQISEMEIRIQNLQVKSSENERSLDNNIDCKGLQNDLSVAQEQFQELTLKYEQLQKINEENEAKVIDLQEAVKNSCDHDSLCVTKLSADMTSDKIAAQRATEQNIILKTRMQELEEAFVKMTQDKLQLTEKITAEKFLNRELTIKLADCEDKCKDMHTKLMAKDDEMIRLLNNYRDLEKEYTEVCNKSRVTENSENCNKEKPFDQNCSESYEKSNENLLLLTDENKNVDEHESSCIAPKKMEKSDHSDIRKEDAMVKLQERFLKIMSEVADLSDEKHRLEHIILQLQNETETICEYVALYQQQRSLLKKRDEERSAQIKLFQIECDRLKRELEELSGILIRFAEDRELAIYFQVESRKRDIEKVRSLLFNLKSNSLVDPHRLDMELSKVYPCNCCSGKLIEV